MNSQIHYLKKLELFKELDNHREGQFFAVADQKVKNHLPQWIQFSPNVFWMKDPESEKNLEAYSRAVEFFLRQGIERSSVLHAFGGGATTDFAGFISATILRGITWVSVPTTLLGMIDGSIGGKVAINMPQGKNLLGAFHYPEKVYICGDFMTSLNDKEMLSGKGEIMKYAFLSKDVFDLVMKKASIEDIAVECARYKMRIVESDFREKGDRVLLNLGHTLGHAFESTLKIPHGQAVIMGLRYIFKLMNQDTNLELWEKIAKALQIPVEKMDLDSYQNFKAQTFLEYLEQDKKKKDQKVRLILVKSIGNCYTEDLPLKELKAKILAHDSFNNIPG